MRYTYIVHPKIEPCFEFNCDVPIPHIQVGNVFQVMSAGYSSINEPKIERIEAFVILDDADSSLRNCRISVFLDA